MKTTITVKDVLQLDYFKNHILIAGESAVNNIVSHVNVAETADFLDTTPQNTIVATLAVNFADDETAFCDWIKTLHNAGISALCIKADVYIKKIPESVKNLGDVLPLPIIISPPESNSTKFIENVTKLIHKMENVKRIYSTAIRIL